MKDVFMKDVYKNLGLDSVGSDKSYLEVWMKIIYDGRIKTRRINKIKKILG